MTSANRPRCVWRRSHIGRYGKEIDAQPLRRDVALASVRPTIGRQPLLVAARRGAVEVEVGTHRESIANAGVAHAETVDLFEDPRGVRVERLATLFGTGEGGGAVILPGVAACLARHVWQTVPAVLW